MGEGGTLLKRQMKTVIKNIHTAARNLRPSIRRSTAINRAVERRIYFKLIKREKG